MTDPRRSGLIIRAQSGFFNVETGEGPVVCQLRGRIKKGPRTGDLAAIGDHVKISVLADGTGVIEEIDERKRAIIRLDPRPRGVYHRRTRRNLPADLAQYPLLI